MNRTSEVFHIRFDCPYLGSGVELSDERQRHIAQQHPEVWPAHREKIGVTLADPDEVRIDADYPRTRLFCRWFDDLLGGKLMVIAVVSDIPPARRHWIVTAFAGGRAVRGEIAWKRG